MVLETSHTGPEPVSELKYSDDAEDMARFGKKSQLKVRGSTSSLWEILQAYNI